jgi:hypothetical protein
MIDINILTLAAYSGIAFIALMLVWAVYGATKG